MFSIITPTFNRADILKRSLDSFFNMEAIEDCQVIVVDDGSVDHTREVLAEFTRRYPGIFVALRQQNQGPGVARNTGLMNAEKDLILFLDDDVRPDRGLIRSHFEFLNRGFDLSQGVLYWHPDIAHSRLLRYMDRRGWQFAFDRVTDDEHLDFLCVYTANVAVPRDVILGCGGFDDKLAPKGYAFEDTGFAYKIWRAGHRLGLNRDAWAWHYHPMTETQLLERNQKVGYAFGILEDHYPQIAEAMHLKPKLRLPGLQKTLLSLILMAPELERFIGWELFLRLRCRKAFIDGLRSYMCRRTQSRSIDSSEAS